jgi:predicted permease
LEAFFAAEGPALLVIAVLFVEALVLWRRGRADPVSILFALLPGVFMMLALRAALLGAAWQEVALWLAASAPVHLADLARRRW